eukprot:COSAG05_NODE_3780_length_1841_cov_32.881171_1_plen_406_part_10
MWMSAASGGEQQQSSARAAALPEGTPRSSRRACPLGNAAVDFAAQLGIDEAYLESSHDRCYCEKCYHGPEVIDSDGPTPYVVPKGWYRLGLKASARATDPELDVFNKWSTSFHGVKSKIVLKSILQCGSLMKPGDKLLDGTKLCSTKCAGRTDHVFYTSPTIKYAGLKFYAEPQLFEHNGVQMAASIALQCKQRPGSFWTQGETMKFRTEWPGHLKQQCPHVDLEQVEWMSETNAAAIVYGILIRPFNQGGDSAVYRSPVDSNCRWRTEELAAAERLLNEMSENKLILKIGFVGGCSAGKSTLINALVGAEINPSNIDPCTSCVVGIRPNGLWNSSNNAWPTLMKCGLQFGVAGHVCDPKFEGSGQFPAAHGSSASLSHADAISQIRGKIHESNQQTRAQFEANHD